MKISIKTKKDVEVNKEQLGLIIMDLLKVSESLNTKYDLNLETIFKFEKK